MPSSDLSILIPYPPRGVGLSINPIFYQPTGSGAVIPVGSAASGKAIPQPGGTLHVDDFGLDVAEEIWTCATKDAASAKPQIRDLHPYLSGMVCTASVTIKGEALRSTIRATYKGLVNGTIRPAKRSCSSDTTMSPIAFPGVDISSVPIPTPVYTLRGASVTEPDKTQEGTFYPSPPQAPKVSTQFQFSTNVPAKGMLVVTFAPHPRGWLCDRVEWDEAGLHYTVTVQYRMFYLYESAVYVP